MLGYYLRVELPLLLGYIGKWALVTLSGFAVIAALAWAIRGLSVLAHLVAEAAGFTEQAVPPVFLLLLFMFGIPLVGGFIQWVVNRPGKNNNYPDHNY